MSQAQLTKNQTLVYATLRAADGPLSAYSILDQLREKGFRAPLQVYRALDKLTEQGLVHRLESLNAFVACCHPDDDHHAATAFAICEDCGDVTEFADSTIDKQLRRWAGDSGFALDKRTIELRGTCKDCSGS